MHEVGAERRVAEPARAAVAAERVERLPRVGVDPVVLRLEDRPAARVGGGVARRERRHDRVLDLGRVARHDPRPRPAARHHRRERDHVVLDDHVGLQLADDLLEARVHVDRAVDQRLPGRLDELGDLLQRRLAEDRRRVADEVDPELPRDLGLRGRRAEPHQALLEPLGLEVAGERLLDDEHDPVAAPPQHVADAHAVVGRAVRPLGEEHDRPAVGHAGTSFVARSVVEGGPMIARAGALAWRVARRRIRCPTPLVLAR